jgi:hypothetical protein
MVMARFSLGALSSQLPQELDVKEPQTAGRSTPAEKKATTAIPGTAIPGDLVP